MAQTRETILDALSKIGLPDGGGNLIHHFILQINHSRLW